MIPRTPRKNRRIVIDGSSFFWGWGRPIDGYENNVIVCVRVPRPLDPAMLEQRNQAIADAWADPLKRERQSRMVKDARAKGLTAHSKPEYKARISASLKAANSTPEAMERNSRNKTAYWEHWRLANGKTKDRRYN